MPRSSFSVISMISFCLFISFQANAQEDFLGELEAGKELQSSRLVHSGARYPNMPMYVDAETEKFTVNVKNKKITWNTVYAFMSKREEEREGSSNTPPLFFRTNTDQNYVAWFRLMPAQDLNSDSPGVIFQIRKTDCVRLSDFLDDVHSSQLNKPNSPLEKAREDGGFGLVFQFNPKLSGIRGYRNYCNSVKYDSVDAEVVVSGKQKENTKW